MISNLELVSAYDENKIRKNKTNFKVGNVVIGRDFTIIAGPCSVESEEQIMKAAELAKKAGANILRGGAYKPRTSPYAFQGLGRIGLGYLRKAGDAMGIPIITEVVDTRDVYLVAEYTDILQIGARNMQNFTLLTEVGKTNKPVLLKRGMNATIEEWLNCAEYILKGGNSRVILCERGIRTYETYTRNTLDLSAVAAIKELTHLPVFVDPSHATGRREMIKPMSLAAVMAGCDGLEVEMHPNPKVALSDKQQQLRGEELEELVKMVRETVEFTAKLE
jgi:3-deoxy-7-phosphoheptulonate synthase